MPTVPPEAVQVLKNFLDASVKKDLPGMKACLTRQSLESGQFDGSGPEGVRMVIGEAHMEDAQAVIIAKGFPLDAPADAPPVMEMPCLIVQEDGQWKFDLMATVERMMGGQIQSAMQQVGDAMGQAMDQVGQAISTAMGGQPESGEDDSSWDQASLTPPADELFPLPELLPLPETSRRISQALGTNIPVEVAPADLLALLGSNQRDELIAWLDNSLFAAWGKTFAGAAEVPTANRLRSVRMEATQQCENRVLVLDGSDLVYRMCLNNREGYFTDEFIAEMVPGILAGLPETIDPAVVGHRVLPLDDEHPTTDSYRALSVARWMRRIRALLGKPVRLEIDWEAAANANKTGPLLPFWGLNRLYGGLALACLDPAHKTELSRDLKTIELAVGSSVSSKFTRYENGKLSAGICYYGGDTPGCYEKEIAAALAGQAME